MKYKLPWPTFQNDTEIVSTTKTPRNVKSKTSDAAIIIHEEGQVDKLAGERRGICRQLQPEQIIEYYGVGSLKIGLFRRIFATGKSVIGIYNRKGEEILVRYFNKDGKLIGVTR